MKFRTLKEDEIEVRVQSVTEKGCILLLYKSSRVDMNILDETVGNLNWTRKHELIGDRLYCTVSIWDDKKGQWIHKQDVGTESNTEKEKGHASDSFKRACFNVGIGRELYTSPFIFAKATECNIKDIKGRKTCSDKFAVEKIAYDDNKNIIGLSIMNTTTKKRVFLMKPQEVK